MAFYLLNAHTKIAESRKIINEQKTVKQKRFKLRNPFCSGHRAKERYKCIYKLISLFAFSATLLWVSAALSALCVSHFLSLFLVASFVPQSFLSET